MSQRFEIKKRKPVWLEETWHVRANNEQEARDKMAFGAGVLIEQEPDGSYEGLDGYIVSVQAAAS